MHPTTAALVRRQVQPHDFHYHARAALSNFLSAGLRARAPEPLVPPRAESAMLQAAHGLKPALARSRPPATRTGFTPSLPGSCSRIRPALEQVLVDRYAARGQKTREIIRQRGDKRQPRQSARVIKR